MSLEAQPSFSLRALFERAALSLLLIWMGLLLCFPLDTYDIWWALSCGKLIVTDWSIPWADPFSHLIGGQAWIDDSWLYQVGVFLVWSLGGVRALVLSKVALLLALHLGIWLGLRRRCVSGGLFALIAIPTTLALAPRAMLRPELVSLVCLSVSLLLLPRRGAPLTWKAIACLTLLQVLWVNGHIGFPLGVVIPAMALVGQFLNRLQSKSERDGASTLRYAALLSLLVIVSMANPYGWHMWLEPFRMMGSDVFKMGITEWRPPWQCDLFIERWGWAMALTPALLALGIQRRRSDFVHWIWLLGFTVLGLQSVRHTSILAIVSLIVAAEAWGEIVSLKASRRWLTPGAVATPILLALIPITALGWLWWGFGFHRRLGLETAVSRFPSTSVSFILDHPLEGEGFHSYSMGGYLMWHLYPEKRVAVDGRLIVYGEEIFTEVTEVSHGTRDWRPVFEDWKVHWALVDLESRVLFGSLWRAPDWHLVHLDPRGALFIDEAPPHLDLIEEFEITPSDLDEMPSVEIPARGNRLFAPPHPSVAISHSMALLEMGRPDLAMDLLTRSEQEGQRTWATDQLKVECLDQLARMAAEGGNWSEAKRRLRELLDLDPENAKAWNNLGVVSALSGDVAEAHRAWQRAIEIDSAYQEARDNMERWPQ